MTYDLEQTLELTAKASAQATGEPVDLTEITCIVENPDGSTSEPEVEHKGTGSYVAEYAPTEPGRHSFGFFGPGVNNEQGTFRVRKRQIPR